jgi:DNA-binding response OmpR family regulator
MREKLLIVEDDVDINCILNRYLELEGYQVISAYSGTEAKLQLSIDTFDLILLDLMLPGLSGEELVEEIRKNSKTPILILSAKNSLEDKVNALKNGADDYITKPFERDEVIARVEALLRRSNLYQSKKLESDCYSIKNLTLKPTSREVFVNGNIISLTASEFDILFFLLKHPNQVYTKDKLFHEIWKTDYFGEDNTINVHISNIRKKIKEYDDSSYIKTVWGIGFKLEND